MRLGLGGHSGCGGRCLDIRERDKSKVAQASLVMELLSSEVGKTGQWDGEEQGMSLSCSWTPV